MCHSKHGVTIIKETYEESHDTLGQNSAVRVKKKSDREQKGLIPLLHTQDKHSESTNTHKFQVSWDHGLDGCYSSFLFQKIHQHRSQLFQIIPFLVVTLETNRPLMSLK